MQIYIHQNGQQIGPFTEEEIRAQLAAGKVGTEDLVWWEGQQGWVLLGTTHLASSAIIPTSAPTTGSAVPLSVSAPVTAVATPSAAPAAARTSGMAIGSLVCGILGFIVCLTSIVAIILGHISLREIKRTPGLGGRGMALAGLIMGYLGVLLFLVVFGISFLLALGKTVKQVEAAKQNQAMTNTAPGQ